MTFATEAQKSASERFFLVRITPRKFIGTGTSIGGGQYTFNIGPGYSISAVTVNEVNEPTYSYASGVLTVTSATNLSNAANVVTIDYDVLLTGTKVRYTSGVSGLPDGEWQPLIAQYPQFAQSMRNIAEGVFSLSNTSLELISTDRWGQSLLGENDSLYNAPVSVWACIDSEATNRKIFDGTVAAVDYSYGRFSLQVIDSFNKLNDSATFGEHAHIISGQFQNTVVPFTLGRSSPMKIDNGWRHVSAEGSPPGGLKHIKDGYRGTLIGPINPDKTSSTSWVLGRCIGGVKRLNFGTIVGNTLYYNINTAVNVDRAVEVFVGAPPTLVTHTENQNIYVVDTIVYIQLQNINDFNGEIGDYIPASYFGGGCDGGWVCGFGAGLYGSYNLAIALQHFNYTNNVSVLPVSNSTGAALSLPNNTIPSMSVWVEAGDSLVYNPKAGQSGFGLPYEILKKSACTRYLPFTLFETNDYTIAGETVKRIDVLVDPSGDLNVSASQLKFRFSPAAPMTHANALKFITEAAGMDTNAATFTQADADLSANVSVTFPLDNGSQFDSYLKAAQAITSSTLGLLRVNESREVEYEIIKNPTAMTTDSVKSSLNMLSGETRTSCQYQDILSRVDFENPQLFGLSEMAGSGATASVDLPKNRQLHRADKVKTSKHYLTSIQNRKAAIAGYLGSPTVEYTLATSSEDLASRIGDVVEITNTAAASSGETVKGIIVGLDQSGSKTTVKINEIRGVP